MKIFQKIKLPIFILIIALLGGISGSQNSSKLFRRVFLPILIFLYSYISLSQSIGYIQSLWSITILSMIGSLSIGYGIPSQTDDGSAFGAFWYKLLGQNEVLANVFTRSTLALGLMVNLLAIPFLTQNWGVYLIGCLIILIGQAYCSWQPWPSYNCTWKGKQFNLLYSDMVNYGCLGLAILIMVK